MNKKGIFFCPSQRANRETFAIPNNRRKIIGRSVGGLIISGAFVLLSASGCGGSTISTQRVPDVREQPRTTSSVIGPNSTIPVDNGQASAILSAYEDSLRDFNMVATKAPLQPNSPVLGDHMTGAELESVISQLLQLSQKGEIDEGSLSTIHSRIKQYTGTQAVVEACGTDAITIRDLKTNQTLSPPPAATELIDALLQKADGVWKVAQLNTVSAGCR